MSIQHALEAAGAEFIDNGVRRRHRRTPEEVAERVRKIMEIADQSAELARALGRLVHELAIDIVPLDENLARQSRAAFIRFGKGRHPAGLNFGDCVSYSLAQSRGLPLLYKGADFGKTDVISAL